MKPIIILFLFLLMTSCNSIQHHKQFKVVFLHHSTGKYVWNGDASRFKFRVGRIYEKLSKKNNPYAAVPLFFKKYNKKNDTKIFIEEITFPKRDPYGWNNYPFDYYNIWVKNSNENLNEPTLEELTQKYDLIIFKHCFPFSKIQADEAIPNINSDIKTVSNYKLQYEAIKEKLHQFPNTKFLLWTGAVEVEANLTQEEAIRTKEFVKWVINEWDQPNDNIFIFDFYFLETDGELYLKKENAANHNNAHPSNAFASRVAQLFCLRILEVLGFTCR